MFELGDVFITPAAMRLLVNTNQTGIELLARHQALDCPELCKSDQQLNREAIKNGDRVLTRYTVSGVRLFIITEWDRSYTTILLADEY